MTETGSDRQGPEVTYFIPMWASCLKSFLGVDICNFFSSLSFRLSPYLNIKTWKNIFSLVKFNFKIFLWPIHCWPWTLPSSHMITLTILAVTLSSENLTIGKMKRILFIIINKKFWTCLGKSYIKMLRLWIL